MSGFDSTPAATPATPVQLGYDHAHLFLALDGNHPARAPLRICLATIDEVVFGRGAARQIEPIGGRRLAVRLDDPRMSAAHALLTRALGRWQLIDAGSKNGTLVNGVARAATRLAHGDVVEFGRTFFVFRDRLPCAGDESAVLVPGGLASPGPGLATLVSSLAEEFARFAIIAASSLSVLLVGETGTGKEVLARTLHALSGRTGEFVAVNCGALPRELVEAELFGHRRGAFSGALADHPGLVRSADQGTLFLDEIGDLPLPAQAALLRVLQEREVRPIGTTRPVAVDLRVVAATHRALDQMVTAGTFRADLLMRLSGHRFALPPLRERREDLGLLIAALLARMAPQAADRVAFGSRAGRALLLHRWPGNVRELEHCLGRAVLLACGGTIEPRHLPDALLLPLAATPAGSKHGDAARRSELLTLLRAHAGNVAAVARQLGKARMQVQRWMKRYRIDPAEFRRQVG